jgi:hypothetical protein
MNSLDEVQDFRLRGSVEFTKGQILCFCLYL